MQDTNNGKQYEIFPIKKETFSMENKIENIKRLWSNDRRRIYKIRRRWK